jgi:predicted hydrocarbon binding protein
MTTVGFLGAEESKPKEKREDTLLLMRPEPFLKMIQALTNTFGSSGAAMIFNMGLSCGYSEASQTREDSGGLRSHDKRELLQKSLQRVSQEGWGQISLNYYDTITGVAGISLKQNPFLEGCGTERLEGCHFLKGFIAGIASEILETDMVYTAEGCGGMKNGACQLQLERASDRSARKIRELLEKTPPDDNLHL